MARDKSRQSQRQRKLYFGLDESERLRPWAKLAEVHRGCTDKHTEVQIMSVVVGYIALDGIEFAIAGINELWKPLLELSQMMRSLG